MKIVTKDRLVQFVPFGMTLKLLKLAPQLFP